jgi:hypothetical protein
MWQLLDINISLERSQKPPLNVLTDTAALLFRTELAGVKVPVERWKKAERICTRPISEAGPRLCRRTRGDRARAKREPGRTQRHNRLRGWTGE